MGTYDLKCEYKDEGSNDEEFGLCDALYCVSIIREKGALSLQPFMIDGEAKENILPFNELHHIMFCLADNLSEDEDLNPYLRTVLKEMVHKTRTFITNGKFKASF